MPEFFKVIISLICLMIANIVIGTKIADFKQEFNKEKLVNGISKAIFTLIGLGLIYGSTVVFPMNVAEINGEMVTTLTGATILLKGANLIYAGKVLVKIKDMFALNIPVEVTKNEDEKQDVRRAHIQEKALKFRAFCGIITIVNKDTKQYLFYWV